MQLLIIIILLALMGLSPMLAIDVACSLGWGHTNKLDKVSHLDGKGYNVSHCDEVRDVEQSKGLVVQDTGCIIGDLNILLLPEGGQC